MVLIMNGHTVNWDCEGYSVRVSKGTTVYSSNTVSSRTKRGDFEDKID